MTYKNSNMLMSSYITSQFIYCFLAWMIHNAKLNDKINKIQETALKLVYSDLKLDFLERLKIDKSVTIKKLAIFFTEIYKVKKGFSILINDIFRYSECPF